MIVNKHVKDIKHYNSKYEWIKHSLLEIELHKPEDFLKIKETLTRIGISSKRNENTLYQSCHILHKKIPLDPEKDMSNRVSRYFICHFKELFVLDGKPSTLTDEDIIRRNKIGELLQEWGLLKIVSVSLIEETKKTENFNSINLKIIPHKEKKNWNLTPKYNIGKDQF